MLFEELDKLQDKKVIQEDLRGGIRRKVFYSDSLGIGWLENINYNANNLEIYEKSTGRIITMKIRRQQHNNNQKKKQNARGRRRSIIISSSM